MRFAIRPALAGAWVHQRKPRRHQPRRIGQPLSRIKIRAPHAGILTLKATMNSSNRMDSLKAILEQDPSHGFARYGLAMEYANTGDLDRAVAEFHTLLENDPNYAAAYYHGGHTLEKLGRLDEARALYEKGIQVTTRTGDAHTRTELQAALDMLPI